MKTILVPLEDCEGAAAMLETAWLLGQSFESYIEGLFIKRALPGVVIADIGGYAAATPEVMESFAEEDQARGQRVRANFEDFAGSKGLTATAGDTPGAGWWDDNEAGDGIVGLYARVFDVTVVGRPVTGATAPAMTTLETVLFESGRPILIAPPSAPRSLGHNIVISWNGSTETARTIAFAMPLLARAQRVVVLAVEGVSVPGPEAAQVALQLRRNGIPAESREVEAGGRGGGEAILAEAASLEADLLVKGAYTHSRLRQMIFGGATSHILAEATLPVFMAH
jgi:nucleotide-binding universal stress UspA family protein